MVDRRAENISMALMMVIAALVCFFPFRSLAASFTVDGKSDKEGLLPYLVYALATQSATGDDILPPGSNAYALLGLFDTGSTAVRINDSNPPRTHKWYGLGDDASLLGFNGINSNSSPPATQRVDVRISGMARSIQSSIGTPPDDLPWISGPGQAGAVDTTIANITVRTDTRPDITLIGTPACLHVRARISYTAVIERMMPKSVNTPYWTGKGPVQAPDITFNPKVSLGSEVIILLQRFGATAPLTGNYDVGQRLWMHGVELNNKNHRLQAPLTGDLNATEARFLFDTGSRVSLMDAGVAASLGLYDPISPATISPDGYSTIDGVANVPGWKLKSVVMTGQGGAYTVVNAWFFISPDVWSGSAIDPNAVAFNGAPIDAVLGSNLFMQTTLFFDGPGNALGIGVKSSGAPHSPQNFQVTN